MFVYVVLVVFKSSIFNCFVSCVFSINEKDFIFFRCNIWKVVKCVVEKWNCFFKVDDMNFVMSVEDERFYFWVLVMSLVIEMYICF